MAAHLVDLLEFFNFAVENLEVKGKDAGGFVILVR
jgi:hypothetical protein